MEASNTSSHTSAAPGSLRQWMSKHPLFSFFFMAYGFSWIMSIPYILSQWGILHGDYRIAFIIKSFGPFLAAYIMLNILEGKTGLNQFRQSIKQVQENWKWYSFILLGIPALFMIAIIALPGALVSFQGFPPNFSVVYLVSFVLIFFGGGPLGEEPGWRGFALPRLQKHYGALWGTLLLGIMWTFWHLPDFLTDAQRGGPGSNLITLLTINLPILLISFICLAIIFTWVYNNTHGSIFIALLLHTSINSFGNIINLFNAPIIANTDLILLVALLVPTLLILILTRGQLGYKPNMEQVLITEVNPVKPILK
jgi:membrane protease YdiL (CAAX protease family)